MKSCLIATWGLWLTLILPVYSQIEPHQHVEDLSRNSLFEGFSDAKRGREAIRIVFYNLENLYDPFNDSLIHDEEFTPQGAKHWNYGRYLKKIQLLAKTILATGGWEAPEIVGLCEVENRKVLQALLYESPLSHFHYRMIHHDSPDPRGVDVAMLFREDKIRCLFDEAIPVTFPPDSVARTRDILYAKCMVLNEDTLHLFINHWPSRFGGYMQTVEKRNRAAFIVRQKADSILGGDPFANILIMGDLNDDPHDESLTVLLKSGGQKDNSTPASLINLMAGYKGAGYAGTLKHGETWHVFDQFIVSHSLLKGQNRLFIQPGQRLIFRAPFLLTEDPGRFGEKLNRTYLGPRYLGGISDHLPIFLDIGLKD